jgi:hypothetical protein
MLIERVRNAMTLREVCVMFFGNPLDKIGLQQLKKQSKLSNSWLSKVMDRLETNEVENWNFRLLGPDKTEVSITKA